MSLEKKFLKNKPLCKVTFQLPKEAVEHVSTVQLLGDFNDWKTDTAYLKKAKDGSFSVTLDLETGRDYQFRYLIDAHTWINDWEADRYDFSPVGNCENSVVALS